MNKTKTLYQSLDEPTVTCPHCEGRGARGEKCIFCRSAKTGRSTGRVAASRVCLKCHKWVLKCTCEHHISAEDSAEIHRALELDRAPMKRGRK